MFKLKSNDKLLIYFFLKCSTYFFIPNEAHHLIIIPQKKKFLESRLPQDGKDFYLSFCKVQNFYG